MSHKVELNSVKKEIDSHIPYILNGELYQIQKQDGENVTVKCCHCPPDRVYRGSVRSTGNFHMHIKRRHPDLLAKLHEMKVTSILQRRDRFVKRKKPKKESPTGMNTRNKIKKEPEHVEENNNSSDLVLEAKSSEILAADPSQVEGTSGANFVPGLKIKSVYQKHQLEQQEQQKRLQQQETVAGQSEEQQQQQQLQKALLSEEEEEGAAAAVAAEHREKPKQQQHQHQQQHQSHSQHNQPDDDSNLLKLNPSGLVGNAHYRNEMKNPINLVLHKMILRNMDNPEDFTIKNRSSLHAQCQAVQNHPIALAPPSPIPMDMVPQLPSSHLHNSTLLNLNRFAAAAASSPSPLINSSPIGYNPRPRDQNSIKKEFVPTYLNGAIDLSISKNGSTSSSGIDGMISGDENPFHFNNHNNNNNNSNNHHHNSGSVNSCNNHCTDVLNSLHSTLNSICKELNFRNRFEFAKFKYVHPDFNL